MGLQLSISKNDNDLYADFENAYWAIEDISYSTAYGYAELYAYASRDAKYKNGEAIKDYSFSFGGAVSPVYNTRIYRWSLTFPLSTVFPDGISLSENEQKTAIYEYVKSYTGLAFTDVLEDD